MWRTARTTACGSCSASRCMVLNHIGNGGRYPGQFYATHNVSLDSKGNLYTVETYTGARLQKFTYKGLGAVAKPEGNHN